MRVVQLTGSLVYTLWEIVPTPSPSLTARDCSCHYWTPLLLLQDILGQDMFLVGAPSSLPRRLALAYCELTGREVEYVSLSRDTTETDLKQRREIVAGTVHYVNQVCISLLGILPSECTIMPLHSRSDHNCFKYSIHAFPFCGGFNLFIWSLYYS